MAESCAAPSATLKASRSLTRSLPQSAQSTTAASSSTTPTRSLRYSASLTKALRDEVNQHAQQLATHQRDAIAELEAWDAWSKLDPDDREAILTEAKLVIVERPDISTDAKLLEALDATPLSAWQDLITLVPIRREQARQHAAKRLEPESVTIAVPSATIKTADDLQTYLDELRARVQPHLDAGKTVIL